MPKVFRLPAHVGDGELRVYWDRTPDEGSTLLLHGPAAERAMLWSALLGDTYTRRVLSLDAVVPMDRHPPVVDQLKKLGYDVETLVFSIRKAASPQPDVPVDDDIHKRLEDAQTAILALSEAVGRVEEAKGVYVLSEDDMDRVRDARGHAEDAVAAALDLLGPAIPADG